MSLAYPELQWLIDLREAGWRWFELPDEIRGVRTWPCGWADAIRVRYVTDAMGLRCDDTGKVIWSREGDLAGVAEALLALSQPV